MVRIFSEILRSIGFEPSNAHPDLWIKDYGTHYEYIAAYVDDIMIFSKDGQKIIDEFEREYLLKNVGEPEYYLGGNFEKRKTYDVRELWCINARTYIKNIIEKIEKLFGICLKKYNTPMEAQDHPELDESPFLDEETTTKYQMLIGCANWAVTLGRFDIY